MKLTMELDREVDGRWIAEVPELNVLLCRDSRPDAIQRAQAAAREIGLDRTAHGKLPPDSASAVFDSAAWDLDLRRRSALAWFRWTASARL